MRRWTYAACAAALFATPCAHADDISSDVALTSFNSRAFISKNDAANYAASAQEITGQYIIKRADGTVMLMTDRVADSKTNATVQLKQRAVYHKLYDKNWSIGGAIAAFLSLNFGKDILKEVTITDLISVTNGDATTSNCLAKKPGILTANDTYYCVTALTLSQILTREYDKTNAVAKGSFAVVTADGSYQLNNAGDGLQFAISISTTPGIKNGAIVPEAHGPALAFQGATPQNITPAALRGMTIKRQQK